MLSCPQRPLSCWEVDCSVSRNPASMCVCTAADAKYCWWACWVKAVSAIDPTNAAPAEWDWSEPSGVGTNCALDWPGLRKVRAGLAHMGTHHTGSHAQTQAAKPKLAQFLSFCRGLSREGPWTWKWTWISAPRFREGCNLSSSKCGLSTCCEGICPGAHTWIRVPDVGLQDKFPIKQQGQRKCSC